MDDSSQRKVTLFFTALNLVCDSLNFAMFEFYFKNNISSQGLYRERLASQEEFQFWRFSINGHFFLLIILL